MGASLPPPGASGSIYRVQWRVLVPIKHGAPAKTRLRAATREQAQHAELVRAIQLDTLDAVLALRTHPLLGGLFVVAGRPGERPAALLVGIEVLPDAGGGLNPALAAAAAELARRHPGDGVMAMVGDLPALRSADLLAVLHQAPESGRSFVRDADGSGTWPPAPASWRQPPACAATSIRWPTCTGACGWASGC